jgi:putative FmdB family regulatory protein
MTYDYECTSCKHAWETEQRITEKPLRVCPRCEKETAKRLISGKGAFVLHGEGWFRSGGY